MEDSGSLTADSALTARRARERTAGSCWLPDALTSTTLRDGATSPRTRISILILLDGDSRTFFMTFNGVGVDINDE